MGLSMSHNSWQGSYSSFHNFREAICQHVFKCSLEDLWQDRCSPDVILKRAAEHPVYFLLDHSDCDGILPWRICAVISNELEEIEDKMEEESWIHEAILIMIGGLRQAYSNKEDLEFY